MEKGKTELRLSLLDAAMTTIGCSWDIPQEVAESMMVDGFAERFSTAHGYDLMMSSTLLFKKERRDRCSLVTNNNSNISSALNSLNRLVRAATGLGEYKYISFLSEAVPRDPSCPVGIEITRDGSRADLYWPFPNILSGRVSSPHVLIYIGDPSGDNTVSIRVLASHVVFDGTALFEFMRRMIDFAVHGDLTSSGVYSNKVCISRDWINQRSIPARERFDLTQPIKRVFGFTFKPPSIAVLALKAAAIGILGVLELAFPRILPGILRKILTSQETVKVTLTNLRASEEECRAVGVKRLSANDIACARIWRATTRVRVNDPQCKVKRGDTTRLAFAVDSRGGLLDYDSDDEDENARLNTKTPRDFAGNLTTTGCAIANVDEILAESEVETAARVRRAVDCMRAEHGAREFLSLIQSVPSTDALSPIWGATINSADLGVSNWSRMKPWSIGGGNFDLVWPDYLSVDGVEGISILTECPSGDRDSLVGFLGVQSRVAEEFKNTIDEENKRAKERY